ncbi:Fur family transcriptional regulator [Aminobacter sp. J44]|uniref:Fur family transcriptional regulator n=1 Tax=Aminobacter sp. J44 TaxID=935262 RepID=UPI0011996430|nr:Fur family transcriptional regulator [Aminobacter sp. J44]TWG50141.1 Fur family zinc uptake transcriptional regulator [Aminobacter sp. J44]
MTSEHHHHHHELTRNQSLVLDTLEKADGPLSAYTILDRLRDNGFRAPLQVYRALEKLLGAGLVHRLESLNAFVACAHPNCHKQGMIAFAICSECGKVDEFADDVVENRLGSWARDNSFKAEKTIIELRGTCAACLQS